MKFAFIIMGDFDSAKDRAFIHGNRVQIIGVSDLDDACAVARELQQQGIDCIELCGAFEEEGARRVIEATDNWIPIGYITHLPEQNEIFQTAFQEI